MKSDSQNTADGAGDPATLATSMGPGLPPALQTALPPQNDAIVGGEADILPPAPAAKPATPLRPAALSLPATDTDTDAGAQYLPQPSEAGKQTAEPQQVPAPTAGLIKDAEQRAATVTRGDVGDRDGRGCGAPFSDGADGHIARIRSRRRRSRCRSIIHNGDRRSASAWSGCVNRHSSTAQLSLNPPDLGPLEIRISLDQDRAHVLFVSPHETVREAIGAAIPRLQDMLGEAGIRLLDVGIERHASGRQPQAFLPPAPHGPGHAEESATDAMGLGTRMAVGLVDYYI